MSSELQSLSNNKTRDGKILGEIKKLEQEGNKSKKDHIRVRLVQLESHCNAMFLIIYLLT